MATLLEIYNLALSACGATRLMANADELTVEGDTVRLWEPFIRDGLLATAPWPSMRVYARITRSRERETEEWGTLTSPAPAYMYAYDPPEDLHRPLHMQSYLPFEWTRGMISTNEENPLLFYISNATNVANWDPHFVQAMVYGLAAAIAAPLARKSDIVVRNYQIAQQVIEEVRASAANYGENRMDSLPGWMVEAGFVRPSPYRYHYPLGDFSLVTSA